MSIERFIYSNQNLELSITRQYLGVGVVGLSPKLTIFKRNTSKYWNGEAWQDSIFELDMLELSSSNSPGEYKYISDIEVSAGDYYYCHMYLSSGKYAFDSYDEINVLPSKVTLELSDENMQVVARALKLVSLLGVDPLANSIYADMAKSLGDKGLDKIFDFVEFNDFFIKNKKDQIKEGSDWYLVLYPKGGTGDPILKQKIEKFGGGPPRDLTGSTAPVTRGETVV